MPSPERREQAVRVISDLLQLLDVPGRVEAQDAADGGISVAIHPDGEFPGVAEGRRSHVVDALQFLVNKIVNRPNTERRWVTIGIGGFRPPRQEQPKPAPKQKVPPSPAPVAASATAAERPATPAPAAAQAARAHEQRPPKAARADQDEGQLEVADDPALTVAIQRMAERSATLGRFYAIAPIKADDRARVLRAASTVPGLKVRAEGEGRHRRVVFHPDKPAPLPKKAMPDYGEDDE